MDIRQPILLVEGVGQLRPEPDRALVYCGVSVFDPSYRAASEELTRLVELLKEELQTLGIKPSDLKTRSFEVRQEPQPQSPQYSPRFVGFRAVTSLELRLPLDKELVGRVVEALQQSGAAPEIHVEFSASNPEQVRAQVLAAAVEDAQERAQTIAQAAHLTLGTILEIKHHSTEPASNVTTDPAKAHTLSETGDGLARDKVLVTWELLQNGKSGLTG